MTSKILSIRDLNLSGRRVLIRVDFYGSVREPDDAMPDRDRVQAMLPTVRHALEAGARVALAAHLDRPKACRQSYLSLEPAGACLADMLNCEVLLTDECVGDAARKVVADLREGQIALLENLSMAPGEAANDDAFARELAQLTDIYVNDAFSVSHLVHASTCALARLVADRAVGLSMEKEIRALTKLRNEAPRPFVAVIGGAGLQHKADLLEALVEQADSVLIGGDAAGTLLAAQGLSIGRGKVESDKVAWARSLLKRAEERNMTLMLPQDLVITGETERNRSRVVDKGKVPRDAKVVDMGPRTIKAFCDKILRSKSAIWYGLLGACDSAASVEGTTRVAQAMVASRGFTVIGENSTVAFARKIGLGDGYAHVSEGEQALLEFLVGRPLAGLEALKTP